jgi:hypothetical protein
VSTFTIIVFWTKPKTALLGSGRPRRRSEPSNPPPEENGNGKDTKVSSLARISYGAQELAVFLFADSPSIFKQFQ